MAVSAKSGGAATCDHLYISFQKQLVPMFHYRCASNISRTLVGNRIVDQSDVVGAPPLGAAPTTSSFPCGFNRLCAKTTARRDEKHFCLGFGALYIRGLVVVLYSVL